jgi:DNA polymerase family A
MTRPTSLTDLAAFLFGDVPGSVEDTAVLRHCYQPVPEFAAEKPRLSDTLDPVPDLRTLPHDAPIAVDLETIGQGKGRHRIPVPWNPGTSLVCVGFSVAGSRFAFPAQDREAIQAVLAFPGPKAFHNSAYDVTWLLASGFRIAGDIHDTMWPMIFEDGLAVHGLKQAGPFVYDVHLPKDTPDMAQVLAYCGNDARATLELFNPTCSWFRHPLYRLQQRMVQRFARLSLEGLPAFPDRIQAAFDAYHIRQQLADTQLAAVAPIKWTSHKQIRNVLSESLPQHRRTKTGQLSTDKDALLECEHPAATLLLEKRRVDKMLGTYLRPILGCECLHGLISLNGARFGRTSSKQANIQNIPRELRTLFGAPDVDWVKVDLAAAELVVAAVLTRCTTLLEWFRTGRDPHTEIAARFYRKALEAVTKHERAAAKVVNFGLLYGGTPRTLVAKAREQPLALSLDEATRFYHEWFEMFPEIARWHAMIERRLYDQKPIISLFGRRWLINPYSTHERNLAWNAPIQSVSSDLFLRGVDRVWDRLPGKVVAYIHDEIDVLVPAGSYDEAQWRSIAREIASIDRRFPLGVEVSVGLDWGSTVTQFIERAAQ